MTNNGIMQWLVCEIEKTGWRVGPGIEVVMLQALDMARADEIEKAKSLEFDNEILRAKLNQRERQHTLKAPLHTCKDGHQEIAYEGQCPLCKIVDTRRFEAAKAAMQGFLSDFATRDWDEKTVVKNSVRYGDSLLAELDKPKTTP